MRYKGISKEIKVKEFIKNKHKYTIKEVLSRGSVANVYLASSEIGDVVVKQFFIDNEEFQKVQDFIYSTINHSFVDKLIDDFYFEGYYFQIKRFYKNYLDLDTLIANLKTKKDKLTLIKEIAEFLDYLHSLNIAHTDLKPEQFIYLQDEGIKLLDFDFGVVDKVAYYPGGTKEWYTPEHIKKEKISIKSDVFTFAEIAHYILTLKHPFERYFDSSFEEAILNENYELLEEKNLFSKMLKVNPDERISINEFLKFFNTAPSKIYLTHNDKKLLLINSKIITRDLCKQYFKNHKKIAPKHFEIIKKDDAWYVRGFEDKRFSKVLVDGIDATNKEVKLQDGSIIKIDDTIFKIIVEGKI